jgi:hypothetical protein
MRVYDWCLGAGVTCVPMQVSALPKLSSLELIGANLKVREHYMFIMVVGWFLLHS